MEREKTPRIIGLTHKYETSLKDGPNIPPFFLSLRTTDEQIIDRRSCQLKELFIKRKDETVSLT